MSLLGCPFCGKVPTITANSGSYGYTPAYIEIKCCYISIKEETEKWEFGKGHFSVEKQARKNIISKWNTRAPL